MAKRVSARPEWLTAAHVVDIYSVSHCVSKDFSSWITHWKHNGYWLFDSPEVIERVAREDGVELQGTSLFFYEVHVQEFDEAEEIWADFAPEPSFPTNVIVPPKKVLEGYDVVSFQCGTTAECSPLSCNHLAAEVETNSHCLLATLEQAKQLLEGGVFSGSEPGPFRVLAVYSVAWPYDRRSSRSGYRCVLVEDPPAEL
jgi:hypothetical protein